jgi:hypothetical protein
VLQYDIRENNVEKTKLETAFASQVFSTLSSPQQQSNDLFQAWHMILQEKDEDCLAFVRESLVKLTFEGKGNSEEYKKLVRYADILMQDPICSADPMTLLTAQQDRKDVFEDYLRYIWKKPENKPIADEYFAVRAQAEFLEDKGRVELTTERKLQRQSSFKDLSFGICATEHRPEGLQFLFNKEIEHAKGMFRPNMKTNIAKKMKELDYPFIAGASGSLAMLICYLKYKKYPKAVIEKLSVIFSAGLIGAGHHSLVEVLFAAKRYNLFDDVKNPLEYVDDGKQTAYEKMLSDFSNVLAKFGFSSFASKNTSEEKPKSFNRAS